MIYCPQCGTSNKPNSKFCKNCSALLQPTTDIRCPICGSMNPQDAEACKSCGTRLKTSAGGASASNQSTPADAPENIAPFNPPEITQEPETTADQPLPASTRAAFSQSHSQWLRRIGTPPPSETKTPEALSAAPAEQENAEWITRLAAASSAAVAAKMVGEAHEEITEAGRVELPTAKAETITDVLPPPEMVVAAEAADTSTVPEGARTGVVAGYDPDELVGTTGPLVGVRGILPLAAALSEPHTLATALAPRADDGRNAQPSLAEPLAAGAPAQSKTRGARLFTSRHLLYLLIFLAAVLALFFVLALRRG